MGKKESPLLPVSDAREAALFFVIGALCFLAALAALATRGTYTAAAAWGAQIEGEITIILDNADQRLAQDGVDLLADRKDVTSAKLLSPAEVDAALEPYFGPGGLPAGLPQPFVIIVSSDSETIEAMPNRLQAALEDQGFSAQVSANWDYARNVDGVLVTLRWLALGVVGLLSATAIAVIAFATHAALLARRDIVEVLHISGAEDRYIASLFERRFWVLALKAGSGGAIAALMVMALIVFTGVHEDTVANQLLPRLTLDFWDMVILFVTPIFAGLAARIAARMTVTSALRSDT